MSLECLSGADNVFGPQVHHCRDSFDFTLLFEQSIFGIVPSAVLLLTLFWKLPVLRKDDSKLSLSACKVRTSRTLKQATAVGVASTQLVLLILWIISASQRTKASIASAALAFIAGLAAILLVSLEHTRSVRPSAVICTYLFSDILLNVPQCRTLWLRNELAISVVFTIGLGMKAFMLWLESQGKQRILKAPYQLYPPEALGGIWHRITFWWLNTLLMKGSKSLLTLEDLYSVDANLSAENLKLKFQRAWTPKSRSVSRYSLMLATFACFKRSLLLLAIPRLFSIGFRFSQPLLILRVTNFLDKSKSENKNFGYGLVGATGLIYLGMAVTTSLYKHQLNRVITMIRGSLVVAIYDKTLSLNESTLGDSAALSLMSSDTETICANMVFLDSLLMSPIEIAFGIALMARQVGVACLAPVLISLASTVLGLKIAAQAGPLQKLWNQATQERVTFTASVLGLPKGMKLLGLTDVLTKLISDLRFDELEKSKGARLYVTWKNFVANLSRIFSPFFTFFIFVYVRGPSALNASEAFTTLALIALITTPIQLLVNALSQFGIGIGCFERIQAYLTLPEGRPSSTENHSTKKAVSPTSKVCTRSTNEATPLQYLPRRNSEAFKIEGGCFTYPGSEQPILQNIDLLIPPSSLTIIVGPVGSGKSTLLKAIVSFCSQGLASSQQLPTDIAYCSQEPWLPNDTVQNIILASSNMHYGWYQNVLKACDLERDLSSMPLSDQTVVGTKGTSLSGGQRQRLALARAIYARKPLLLLDDVLSSLDSRTIQTVFDNVLGPGGLARKYKTAVVLVTHSKSHLRQADNILVLGAGGHVAKQGTFEQIFSQNPLMDLMSEIVSETPVAESERLGDEQLHQRPEQTPVQDSKFEDEQQDLARKTGDLSLYGYYGRSLGYKNLFIYATVLAMQIFSTYFATIWLQWWSGRRFSIGTGSYLGVYSAFTAVQVITMITFPAYLLMYLVPKSSMALHGQLLRATMKAPYRFFLQTDAGVILTRFSQDISLIDKQLAGAALMFSYGLFSCVAEAILIALGQKFLAIGMIPIVGILYLLQNFYLRTSRQLRFLELEAQSGLYTQFMETINGIATIQAFGWQQNSKLHCMRLLDTAQRPFYMMFCIQRWLNFMLDVIVAIVAASVVAIAVMLPATTSAGAIGVSMVNILNFGQSLAFLITTWTALETSLGAVARVKNFEATIESEDSLEARNSPPQNWPQSGTLAICNFSAAYNANSADALSVIDLKIKHGEKIGICGRSGSGKSSLVLALFSMLHVTGGSIHLDSQDISLIPTKTVRKQISCVPQESLILPGTVRFNIDPLNEKSDREIAEALEKVGLWHLLVAGGGLDEEIVKMSLSGGQKQLLGLARVLLRKDQAKILVLDEVASSVDAETERRMMNIIAEEFRDSTVVAIAHRLQSVKDFDRVVVMDCGKIVEFGHPHDLLKTEGSLFLDMWNRHCGNQ